MRRDYSLQCGVVWYIEASHQTLFCRDGVGSPTIRANSIRSVVQVPTNQAALNVMSDLMPNVMLNQPVVDPRNLGCAKETYLLLA